jgi:hypothetical protein
VGAAGRPAVQEGDRQRHRHDHDGAPQLPGARRLR